MVIIGAGLAGLVAAYELERQGHDPIVLEAQNRVGGRIYTLRDFAPGLYAEAGGMRIPRVHDLTLRYCEEFGLELRPFTMGNPKGLVYIGGVRMTSEEASRRAGSAVVPGRRRGARAHRPTRCGRRPRATSARCSTPAATGAWDEIAAQYDQYSLYEFLKLRGFSEGAIEYYAVMNFLEADMHNAVVEILREDLGGAYVDMQEIVGGMDLLPRAFYGALQDARPVRGRGARAGPGRRRRDRALQDRGGSIPGARRLRDRDGAVLGAALDRGAAAVLARQAARDPAAQLPRLDEDPVPGARPALGDGGRDPGRRLGDRSAGSGG